MSFAALTARAARERALAVTVADGVLALLLLAGLAVYREIDTSVYDDLPEALRRVMGIPEGADAATLAFDVIFGSIGALVLASLAISIGTASVAGEERAGRMGLLLANPISRTRLVLAKASALAVLAGAAAGGLWVAGLAAPALLGVETGSLEVGAMAVHLGVNALFWGALALAVGAVTGSRSLATAASVGVMACSFVAVGLLPMVGALSGGERAFPWWYFDGGEPLVNGVVWLHLGVLVAGAAAAAAVAAVGFVRRDLVPGAARPYLLARLRANHLTRRLAGLLGRPGRASRPWTRLVAGHLGVLTLTAAAAFAFMGVLIAAMYGFVEDSLAGFSRDLPAGVLSIAGGGDTSTPEGWLQLETFGLLAPAAVIAMATVVAVSGVAGQEEAGTMGLLLSNPLSRRRVVLETALAMGVYAGVTGGAVFAGTALGSLVAGLGVSVGHLAATCLLLTLLGAAFGALALAIGAATGRAAVAAYATAGAALSLHLLDALLAVGQDLAGWARASPFHYYLGSDPLNTGLRWSHAAVLAGLGAALVAVAVASFERRDLRRH